MAWESLGRFGGMWGKIKIPERGFQNQKTPFRESVAGKSIFTLADGLCEVREVRREHIADIANAEGVGV